MAGLGVPGRGQLPFFGLPEDNLRAVCKTEPHRDTHPAGSVNHPHQIPLADGSPGPVVLVLGIVIDTCFIIAVVVEVENIIPHAGNGQTAFPVHKAPAVPEVIVGGIAHCHKTVPEIPHPVKAPNLAAQHIFPEVPLDSEEALVGKVGGIHTRIPGPAFLGQVIHLLQYLPLALGLILINFGQ